MKNSAWQIFLIFLKLGLTSFGGPVAHLGYFRNEFVEKRQWFTDSQYADLVALCQFLPGPASSQVGIGIGLSQAGYKGAICAWLGFTMPSAIALILFAIGITHYDAAIAEGALHGLKIVAVAIVAQAIWGMAKSLCPDKERITIMVATTCFILMMPTILGQILAIVLSGMIGMVCFKSKASANSQVVFSQISARSGVIWLLLFAALFIVLPLLATIYPNTTFIMIDKFYRTGALVFGGGHVVLPLLQTELVPIGLVDGELFLAGYGVTQAVPGPLFTFAAFLGAVMNSEPNGWLGGLIALIAIFVPSFLLVLGILPFWDKLSQHSKTKSALLGINASVVGLLIAAFYQPIWTSSILNATDFSLAFIAFAALMYWKIPTWLVVIISGCVGFILHSPFILEIF